MAHLAQTEQQQTTLTFKHVFVYYLSQNLDIGALHCNNNMSWYRIVRPRYQSTSDDDNSATQEQHKHKYGYNHDVLYIQEYHSS